MAASMNSCWGIDMLLDRWYRASTHSRKDEREVEEEIEEEIEEEEEVEVEEEEGASVFEVEVDCEVEDSFPCI